MNFQSTHIFHPHLEGILTTLMIIINYKYLFDNIEKLFENISLK